MAQNTELKNAKKEYQKGHVILILNLLSENSDFCLPGGLITDKLSDIKILN